MRVLKYHVAITLDGFLADAAGAHAAFLHTGEHATEYLRALDTYDAVLMGRATYDCALQQGVVDPYPKLSTYVFSSSLGESPSPRVQLVATDAVGAVRALKARPGGDIYLCGGGKLAATLFEANLIDEVIVKVNPVLLGSGIPLVSALSAPRALRLLTSTPYASGVVTMRYAVAR